MASIQLGGIIKTDVHMIIVTRISSQSLINIHNSQVRVIFNKSFKVNVYIPIYRQLRAL